MLFLKRTTSVCPECMRLLDAELWEINDQVIMKKTCPEHGSFEDLYWSDYQEYVRAEKFRDDGNGLSNPRPSRLGCPYDCGPCEKHKTHTTLLIIDLTNRCNLKCPICFAAAHAADYIYEPTIDQVRAIVEYAKEMNEPNIVQGILNSGGEPTVREDLFDILKMEKELGIDYIVLATNGIRMAEDIEYFKKLRDLGVYMYLQFDGVTPEPYKTARGRDLWPVKQKIIENARKIGYDKIALVPTIVKGVNDDQVGDIVRYAAQNPDVIRHMVFQPVSFTGRIDRSKLKEMRITTPDVMRLFEEQTKGEIKKSDFFTLPMSQTLAKMVTKGGRHRDFCIHPHCGVIALVTLEKGKFVPINRFINNEKLYFRMRRAFEMKKSRPALMWDLVTGFIMYVKPSFWLKLFPLLKTRSYKSGRMLVDDWMRNTWITIGIMQFMDPYNFDIERAQRCCLHYGVPDKDHKARLIPFCAMNNFHRPSVEKEFSTSSKAERSEEATTGKPGAAVKQPVSMK
ncbi:MAG: radical SAM protein [Dehalococcoidia bacterium]|nr:radical SAM protein [Dehalococcoidia bacterium]